MLRRARLVLATVVLLALAPLLGSPVVSTDGTPGGAAVTNLPPMVDAHTGGEWYNGTAGVAINLLGAVADDGRPQGGSFNQLWTDDCTGTVTYGDATQPQTTVTVDDTQACTATLTACDDGAVGACSGLENLETALLIIAPPPDTPPDEGDPLIRYTFASGSGDAVNSGSAGATYDGTVTGATYVSDGGGGFDLLFDDDADEASVPDGFAGTLQAFTLAIWAIPDAQCQSNGSRLATKLCTQGQCGSTHSDDWAAHCKPVGDGNAFDCRANTDQGQFDTNSDNEFPVDEKVLVACEWDGAQLCAYQNGIRDDDGCVAAPGTLVDSGRPFVLGRHPDNTTNRVFRGKIPEVRGFWPHLLSAAEHQALFDEQDVDDPPAPVIQGAPLTATTSSLAITGFHGDPDSTPSCDWAVTQAGSILGSASFNPATGLSTTLENITETPATDGQIELCCDDGVNPEQCVQSQVSYAAPTGSVVIRAQGGGSLSAFITKGAGIDPDFGTAEVCNDSETGFGAVTIDNPGVTFFASPPDCGNSTTGWIDIGALQTACDGQVLAEGACCSASVTGTEGGSPGECVAGAVEVALQVQADSGTLSDTVTANLQVSAVGGEAASEARCTELGSDCDCSEPLRFDTLKSLPNQVGYDPEDSEGSGAKECNDGDAVDQLHGEPGAAVVSGSSVGLPQVSRVLEATVGEGMGSVRVIASGGKDFTQGTFCSRVYFREDLQAPPIPTESGHDLKFSTFKGGSAPNPGTSAALNGNEIRLNVGFDFFFGLRETCGRTVPTSGDQINIDPDCSIDGWCFFEQCWDHGPDNKLTIRARARALASGKQTEFGPCTGTIPQSSVQTGSASRIFRGHCDRKAKNGTVTDTECNGKKRYLSHAITAISEPASSNFWIGPAIEIEGCTQSDPNFCPSSPTACDLVPNNPNCP